MRSAKYSVPMGVNEILSVLSTFIFQFFRDSVKLSEDSTFLSMVFRENRLKKGRTFLSGVKEICDCTVKQF
jgi:hypothetical protein